MSERESDGWGMWTHTHDPRDGWQATALFLVETLLALGLLVRVTAHCLATSVQYPDAHPYDVRYGLGWSWQVREPRIARDDQLLTSIVLATLAVVAATLHWPAVSLGPGTALILAANLVVVAGDPLFILIAWTNQ